MMKWISSWLVFFAACSTSPVHVQGVTHEKGSFQFYLESDRPYFHQICGTKSSELSLGDGPPFTLSLPQYSSTEYYADGKWIAPSHPMDEGCDVLECVPYSEPIEQMPDTYYEVSKVPSPVKGYPPITAYRTTPLHGKLRFTYYFYSDSQCEKENSVSYDFRAD